jgi:hypothetical protein
MNPLLLALPLAALYAFALYKERCALEKTVLKPTAKALGYKAHINKWTGKVTITPPKDES